MAQLVTCHCDRCGTDFAMSQDKVDDMAELTCPVCERSVTIPDGPDEGDLDSEEDDELGLEQRPVRSRRRR